MGSQFVMFGGAFPRMTLPIAPITPIARRRPVGAAYDPWALAHVPGQRPPRDVLRDGSHVRVGP
jgi:hypothetical protein